MKDLKLLVKDYAVSYAFLQKFRNLSRQALTGNVKPVAKNALTILINISKHPDVLGLLAEDDAFLETLLARVTVSQLPYPPRYPTARSFVPLTSQYTLINGYHRTPKSQTRTPSPCS